MHAKTHVYLKDHSSFEAVALVHQVNSTHFLNAAQMYVIMQYVGYYIIDCGGLEKDKLLCCVNTSKNSQDHIFTYLYWE